MFAFYFQSHLNHNCAGICCCGIRYAACWLGYNSKTQTMNVSSVHMRVAFAASTAFWSPSHYKGGYQVFYPLGFQTGCPQLTKSGLYQLGCAVQSLLRMHGCCSGQLGFLPKLVWSNCTYYSVPKQFGNVPKNRCTCEAWVGLSQLLMRFR